MTTGYADLYLFAIDQKTSQRAIVDGNTSIYKPKQGLKHF